MLTNCYTSQTPTEELFQKSESFLREIRDSLKPGTLNGVPLKKIPEDRKGLIRGLCDSFERTLLNYKQITKSP